MKCTVQNQKQRVRVTIRTAVIRGNRNGRGNASERSAAHTAAPICSTAAACPPPIGQAATTAPCCSLTALCCASSTGSRKRSTVKAVPCRRQRLRASACAAIGEGSEMCAATRPPGVAHVRRTSTGVLSSRPSCCCKKRAAAALASRKNAAAARAAAAALASGGGGGCTRPGRKPGGDRTRPMTTMSMCLCGLATGGGGCCRADGRV